MYSQSVVSFQDKKIPAHLYTIFSCVFIVIYMYVHTRVHTYKRLFENQGTLINRSSKSNNNLSSS